MADVKPLSLTNEQRQQLKQIAAGGRATLQRRARLVLLAADGQSVGDTAQAVGLSESRVRHWLRRYRAEGMAIFGEGAAAAAVQKAPPERSSKAEKKAVTLEALCRRYSVNMAHANYVAGLALRLFDATRELHGLPDKTQRLLRAGAILHNIAYGIDPPQHHLVGRNIILKQPIEGFSAAERRMLACMTAFHRKKVRPEKEPAFAALKKTRQQQVLALTALLRVADGLDYSHTQTCKIANIMVGKEALEIAVEGEYADLNGARAEKMADLWAQLFDLPVRVVWRYRADMVRADAIRVPLDGALTLPEAGRVLMGHYLLLVEQHADSLRSGDGADVLPYLVRDAGRLRGVLAIFGDYFDAAVLAHFKKTARWLYRNANEALMARSVADLMQAHSRSLPGEITSEQTTMVLKGWLAEADEKLKRLQKLLDGRRYRRFLSELLSFSRKPGIGVFPGAHTRIRINTQAGLWVWQYYTGLRVWERGDEDVQAQWRRVRRFHHLLQFLFDLLGPEVEAVIATVQALETNLHEILVGEAALRALGHPLPPDKDAGKKQREALKAVRKALAAVEQAQLEEAQARLADRWAALESADFRRNLALAIAAP